jgi:hypothetical protein
MLWMLVPWVAFADGFPCQPNADALRVLPGPGAVQVSPRSLLTVIRQDRATCFGLADRWDVEVLEGDELVFSRTDILGTGEMLTRSVVPWKQDTTYTLRLVAINLSPRDGSPPQDRAWRWSITTGSGAPDLPPAPDITRVWGAFERQSGSVLIYPILHFESPEVTNGFLIMEVFHEGVLVMATPLESGTQLGARPEPEDPSQVSLDGVWGSGAERRVVQPTMPEQVCVTVRLGNAAGENGIAEEVCGPLERVGGGCHSLPLRPTALLLVGAWTLMGLFRRRRRLVAYDGG